MTNKNKIYSVVTSAHNADFTKSLYMLFQLNGEMLSILDFVRPQVKSSKMTSSHKKFWRRDDK